MNCIKTMPLLLAWMMACAGGLSCRPFESQATEGKEKLQNDKRSLLREEIVNIATAAGRQYERDPEKWETVVDEGNIRWREFVVHTLWEPSYDARGEVWPEITDDELKAAIAKRWPMLNNREYQVVTYRPRPPQTYGTDMGMEVLIDKSTGEIIVALGQWGQVLKPKSGSIKSKGNTRKDMWNNNMEGNADVAGKELTREQIIQNANAELRRRGLDPSRYDIRYQGANAAWVSVAKVAKVHLSELDGHNYQVVKYTLRDSNSLGADIYVFVDRNTGSVLALVPVG
jgi:hypothetical protein